MIGILKINFDCKISEQIKTWIYTHFNALLETVCCKAESNAVSNLEISGSSLTQQCCYAHFGFRERLRPFCSDPRPRRGRHILAPRDQGDPATLPTLVSVRLPNSNQASSSNPWKP